MHVNNPLTQSDVNCLDVKIHPIAKAAVSAVTLAYDVCLVLLPPYLTHSHLITQHLKKQAQCDSNVTDLATNMHDMLFAVEVAKDNAKIKLLVDTIEDILIVTEDTAKFIVRYQTDGLASKLSQH
jgi:hypothetical protein